MLEEECIIHNCSELHDNKYKQYKWEQCNQYWKTKTLDTILIHKVYENHCLQFKCDATSRIMRKVTIDDDFRIQNGLVYKILDGPSGTINKYLSMDWDSGLGGVKSAFKSEHTIVTVDKQEFLNFIRDTLYIKRGKLDTMLRKYEKMEIEHNN